MKDTLNKIGFFICTWVATSFVIYFLGIRSFLKIRGIPEHYEHYAFWGDITLMFAATVVALAISFLKFSLDTRKKLKETQIKIDELTSKTRFEIKELKKHINTPTTSSRATTADDFFDTRSDDESFFDTIQSKPKSIKYSGGNMDNLISVMVGSQSFTDYIINNSDVKVQFLFPDPNNKDVIENFADHITTGNMRNTYRKGVKNAVEQLSNFIKRHNLEDRVEYRFYKFAPSFGLRIIEGGVNDRLYVDLYTIGIAKDFRYCFKIEKDNCPDTYPVFQEQYEKLWGISSKRKKFNPFLLW